MQQTNNLIEYWVIFSRLVVREVVAVGYLWGEVLRIVSDKDNIALVVCEVFWFENNAEEGHPGRVGDKKEEEDLCVEVEDVCAVVIIKFFLLVLRERLLLQLRTHIIPHPAQLALNPLITQLSLPHHHLIHTDPTRLHQEIRLQTLLTPQVPYPLT